MSKGKESSAGSPEQRCVSNTPASGELNVANLQEAEVEIIKQVQRQAFPSEIRSLQIIQANAKYGSQEGEKEKKAVLKKTREENHNGRGITLNELRASGY